MFLTIRPVRAISLDMSEQRLHPLPVEPPRTAAQDGDTGAACALCGRALGDKVEKHHLVPRLKGGTKTVPLHPICHKKIHSLFSESELASSFNTIETLTDHPDMAAFIKWVRKRPAGFHKRTRKAGGGRGRR